MASSIADAKAWPADQSINVVVDYSTEQLLAVKYVSEGKVYRGVLLADDQRIGVNETRAAGAETWLSFTTDSNHGLSLNSTACCAERFTYKANGEASRFSILHSSNKRLFPSRGPSRSVFRSKLENLCQICKKSINSSSSDLYSQEETSPKTSKRGHNANDSHQEGKSLPSGKRRRLDETTSKKDSIKSKKSKDIEGGSVKKKATESKDTSPSAGATAVSNFPLEINKAQLSIEKPPPKFEHDSSNAEFVKESLRTDRRRMAKPHEKRMNFDRQTSTKGEKETTSKVPELPQAPVVITTNPEPPRPHIKIKINRALILGDGDAASNQSGNSEVSGGYKVEVLHDEPAPTVSEALTPQKLASPYPIADSASSTHSSLVYDPQLVTESNIIDAYQVPSSSITFRMGDVVWGKLSGWPWWPARVTRLCLRSPYSCIAQITWFGTNETNELSCDKILPFLANYEKKLDKRKYKQGKQNSYKKAIDAAMALAQPQGAQSSVVADIANQETTNGDDASETLFPPEIEPEELRPEFEEILAQRMAKLFKIKRFIEEDEQASVYIYCVQISFPLFIIGQELPLSSYPHSAVHSIVV
nr:PWWP domain containing protein 2A [Hymenolepis microstoma]